MSLLEISELRIGLGISYIGSLLYVFYLDIRITNWTWNFL